jgi:hypothetical protein
MDQKSTEDHSDEKSKIAVAIAMTDQRYIVMTVECSRCKTKQKVHVAARPGPTVMADHRIPCIKCDLHFKVSVPDRIIDGPFPA